LTSCGTRTFAQCVTAASIAALEFSVTMPRMTAFRDEAAIVTGTLRGVDAATQGHERSAQL
jgi:hypothetical protein